MMPQQQQEPQQQQQEQRRPLLLSAPGPRSPRVTPDEAAAIRERFRIQLEQYYNNNHNEDNDAVAAGIELDLSCRCWSKECWEELLFGTTSPSDDNNSNNNNNNTVSLVELLRPHLSILKVDDTIASLPTEEGLEALALIATQFAGGTAGTATTTTTTVTPQLHTVHLHDNALGTRGVEQIMPLLQHPHVQVWTLDNCGLAAADAATLLELWRNNNNNNDLLQSLSLGRNQMGPEGAAYMGELLVSLTKLQHFSYYGCRPLRDGTRALCEGLAALVHPELVLTLRLEDSDVGGGANGVAVTALCQFLTRATQLRHLNLRDCSLEADGFVAVVEALQNRNNSNTALQHWDMGGNGEVGEVGAVALRDFFLSQDAPAALTTLILDANEFGDDGVTAVVEGLAYSSNHDIIHNLQTLRLDANEIEREGAQALVRNRIASLQTLALTDNMDFPANAARRLQTMYPTVEVEEDLEDDPDWEEEEEEEEEAAVDELGVALAQAQI